MTWDEARARREESARAKAARAAGASDAQATEPLPAVDAPAGDGGRADGGPRWWTVRPMAAHGWKVAAGLATLAIVLSGIALLTHDDHPAAAGRHDGGRGVQVDDRSPQGGWGDDRGPRNGGRSHR